VLEVRITRVHVAPELLVKDRPNHLDPNLWKPVITSFSHYYGLGRELAVSRLARIPEEQYRTPDVDRANAEALGDLTLGRVAAD
jgi:hypothetical protein